MEWPAAKNFAHIICAQMASDSPTKYLDTMSKKDRVGRIFLDYLRNDRTSTAVAVLSTRARPGATISMPIHWKEVKSGLEPARFDIRTGPGILKKSKPWAEYEKSARSLSAAIEKVGSRGRRDVRILRRGSLSARRHDRRAQRHENQQRRDHPECHRQPDVLGDEPDDGGT